MVVTTISVPAGVGSRAGRELDVARAAHHQAMRRALGTLGDVLRRCRYDNSPGAGSVAKFALGFTIEMDALAKALPAKATMALVESGLAAEMGPRIRLHGSVMAAGETLVFVPRDGRRLDRVYVGRDSLILHAAVRQLRSKGERAVELGSGPGLVAASLAETYRTAVATDVVDRLASAALLTGALNNRPRGHCLQACVADVGASLRTSSFDFVAANTPWVPSGSAKAYLYADGGPSGFELPARFVTEGWRLLRVGGVAVFLLADLAFSDGRSSLRDLCAKLWESGAETWVLPTPYLRGDAMWDRLAAALPGVSTARHVALVVVRPPVPPTLPAALARLAKAWTSRPEQPRR